MQRPRGQFISRIIPVIALVLTTAVQFIPTKAEAVFVQAYIRLDRMMISTATGGTVCARASSAAFTEAKVVITFPSTYSVNTTAANWTTSTTDLPAGASAWPSIQANATSATSPANVVTFTSGNIPNNTTLYCFNFSGTNTLTTASSAANSQQASIETQDSGNAPLDHSDIALANITNDQIVVSAVVPPTFLFTLSGNTDNFGGNLDPATVKSSAGRTVTVTTNAKGGWIVWAKDTEQGLRSTSASYTIQTVGTLSSGTYANGVPDGTPTTLSAGTEGYVFDADVTTDATGGCTVAPGDEYNGTTTSMGGSAMGNFQPIASCTGPNPATANGDVITLIERVAIAGATPAGSDYGDIITVVGAGNF